jgi:hypothetical protein
MNARNLRSPGSKSFRLEMFRFQTQTARDAQAAPASRRPKGEVRIGSFSDLCAVQTDVCFCCDSRHWRRRPSKGWRSGGLSAIGRQGPLGLARNAGYARPHLLRKSGAGKSVVAEAHGWSSAAQGGNLFERYCPQHLVIRRWVDSTNCW